MALDRNAGVEYAKKFWNRVCDDDKFWNKDWFVLVKDKRKSMDAPATENWEALFVSDGAGGEKAVFRRTVKGKTEEKPDPISVWSGPQGLNDCTHFVSRCLMAEGLSITETPRAHELSTALISASNTKTLALQVSRAQGQKVVDSGIFKEGDFVGYAKENGNYEHTAMFVGRQVGGATDPGGITCHTVCRFQGLSAAWNGATDDVWFLHEEKGRSYTLVHFAEDDPPISPTTLQWLPGWWQIGNDFYFVTTGGHGFATPQKPTRPAQKLLNANTVGYYFEGKPVIFIWRKPGSKTQVEKWTAPTGGKAATVEIDGVPSRATRVF